MGSLSEGSKNSSLRKDRKISTESAGKICHSAPGRVNVMSSDHIMRLMVQVTSRCNFVVPLVSPSAPMAMYNFGPVGEQQLVARQKQLANIIYTEIGHYSTFRKVGSKIINPAFTDQVGTLDRYAQEEPIAEFAEGRLEICLGRPVFDAETQSIIVPNTTNGHTFSFSMACSSDLSSSNTKKSLAAIHDLSWSVSQSMGVTQSFP